MIHLHIIPHTHNDLGWLYTMEQYYDGSNPRGCVKCILDSVVEELVKNPDRKFSYSEMAFFKKWWSEQDQDKKKIVRKLIANGQFNFLNAGFVMNDEGCAYYDEIIEQLTLGHRFIKNEFNQTVNTGWHIDPFGHSASQAAIFSQMGFNSFFIERINQDEFDERIKDGTMEMIWKPQTPSNNNFIMTHVNFMKYYLAPLDYCINVICGYSIDDAAKSKIERYVKWVRNQAISYSTSNIMHQMGGDFVWGGGVSELFTGTENMIKYINSNPSFGINASYSTPSIYAQAVYEETKRLEINLTFKTNDFMPYKDNPNSYWTGYYTSRPYLKRAIRQAGQQVQSFRKFLSKLYLAKPAYATISFEETNAALTVLEENIAILQHHYAITGTATQDVTYDYINKLRIGYNNINSVRHN